jgi:phage terminase small subunit
MREMSTQKKKFADGVISGLSKTKAAIEAGYSAATASSKGHQLAADPLVKAYIEKGEDRSLHRAEITAEWILSETKRLAKVAEAAGDIKGALKGIEMLGKNKRLWTDVQEHQFNLKEMGRVMIAQGDTAVALEFNVGQEPNALEGPKK